MTNIAIICAVLGVIAIVGGLLYHLSGRDRDDGMDAYDRYVDELHRK